MKANAQVKKLDIKCMDGQIDGKLVRIMSKGIERKKRNRIKEE